LDVDELASALAKSFAAARGEDLAALRDALRVVADAIDRLTDVLDRRSA
jgi:hypothetical protein